MHATAGSCHTGAALGTLDAAQIVGVAIFVSINCCCYRRVAPRLTGHVCPLLLRPVDSGNQIEKSVLPSQPIDRDRQSLDTAHCDQRI
jgi:hypothetical protein